MAIRYYYNPVVKSDANRYYVDYFCTDGKKSIWTGRTYKDSPTAALRQVRKLVEILNKPRPFFGRDGRLAQWFWWKNKKLKQLKK